MSKQVRIHLKQAILVGIGNHQRYAKVLVGEHEPGTDIRHGVTTFQTFVVCGYVFSYKYHKLPAPAITYLADTNILAVEDHTEPTAEYTERNAHEFLARQLFAVPDGTPLTRQQYDDAKNISLGLGYGMREADLARLLHRPVDQVAALLDRYLSFLGISHAPVRGAVECAGPWQAQSYPVKQCPKQFEHQRHNYRTPEVNTTCLGRDH